MAMKRAEHYGRCQACNRLQKLPDGLLAKHGYKVAGYGYFAGVCHGSAQLPYEKDCTYIRNTIIPEVKVEEASLVIFCAKLRIQPDEPKGYHQIYTPLGAIWNKLEILGEPEHKYPMLKVGVSQYNKSGLKPISRFSWLPCCEATPEGLLKLAAAMNEYYAKHVENCDLRKIRRYLSWQEGRVANWKETPLPPVDVAKDLRKKLEKEFIKREAEFIAA